jgi:hypothetical protein
MAGVFTTWKAAMLRMLLGRHPPSVMAAPGSGVLGHDRSHPACKNIALLGREQLFRREQADQRGTGPK